jgi:hypothetical protein
VEPSPPINIGPGSYNVGFNFGKKVKEQRIRVKEEPRCPSLITPNAVIPGPGAY